MKYPFILLDDGMVVVHDHDSGDVIEGYEGIAKLHGPYHNSFYLLGYEGNDRTMTHLGFDEESAINKLSAIAVGAMK